MTSMRFVGPNGWNQCVRTWSSVGILKGRWRVLKSGVRINGVDSVDYVWFTCCALHNWLLDIDGLSEKWLGGVQQCASDWDGAMGCLDSDGVQKEVPNALARLSENLDARNYDSSGLGPGLDVIPTARRLQNKLNSVLTFNYIIESAKWAIAIKQLRAHSHDVLFFVAIEIILNQCASL